MAAVAVAPVELPRVSSPSRRNSLQRMLELEKRFQLDRIRAASPTPSHGSRPFSPAPPIPLRSPAHTHTRPVSATSSLVQEVLLPTPTTSQLSSPLLRITIPSHTMSPMPQPGEWVRSPTSPRKSVSFLTPDGDSDSEKESSICHSPSWEGYGQRQKEARQRRKEREQADKEARAAKKQHPSKLHKMPPSSMRSPASATGPHNGSAFPGAPARDLGSRPHSSGNGAAGIREQDSNSRWRHGRPTSDLGPPASPSFLVHHRQSNTGFIGGVKLQHQEEEDLARQRTWNGQIVGSPTVDPRANSRPLVEQATSFGHGRSVPPPVFGPHSSAFTGVHQQQQMQQRQLQQHSPLTLYQQQLQREQQLQHHQQQHSQHPPHQAPLEVPVRRTSLRDPSPSGLSVLERVMSWREGGGRSPASDETPADHDRDPDEDRGRKGHGEERHKRRRSVERALAGLFGEKRKPRSTHYPPSASKSKGLALDGRPPSFAGSTTGQGSGSGHQRTMSLTSVSSIDPAGGQPLQRSRSRTNSLTNAIGSLKGAARAALHRRRSSSRDSRCSSSEYSQSDPAEGQAPEPELSSSAELQARGVPMPVNPPRAMDQRRPSAIGSSHMERLSDSSSASSYDHSPKSSTVTTPDTSRPQSERGSSSESTSTKNKTPSRYTGGSLPKATPSMESLPGSFAFQSEDGQRGKKGRPRTRDGDETPGDAWGSAGLAINTNGQASISAMTLLPHNGSKASLVPPALETTPAKTPQRKSSSENTSIRERKSSLKAGSGSTELTDVPNGPTHFLRRESSLSKSQSSPELLKDLLAAGSRQQPLAPPPKSKARQYSGGNQGLVGMQRDQFTQRHMSMSAIPSHPAVQSRPSVANGAAYLEAARRFTHAAPPPRQGLRRPAPISTSSITASSAMTDLGRRTDPKPNSPTANLVEPIAKVLVECCGCKFFHDMPSKLYECMAQPDGVVEDRRLGVSGAVSTTVRCPWCAHGMTRRCCAGYAAVVYLNERLH